MNPIVMMLGVIILIFLMLSLFLSHILKPGGAKTFFSILTYITVILVILLIIWLVLRLFSYEKAAKIGIPNTVNPLYLKRSAI